MSHKPIASLLAIFAGLTVVLAGCKGNSSGGGMQPTITLAKAARKVDEYAEAAQLPLAVKFTNPDKNYDFPCSNADGSPAKNRRDASVSYQLEGAPPEKTFEALRT
ncbi:hypothetical protein [Amycolatopsis sp. NPDC059657]|uniref:hypothetical protein n=1 Tax=Amycolatopsis sp. NPDC059657 TaxID=3346899 RepID=UPI00366A90D1